MYKKKVREYNLISKFKAVKRRNTAVFRESEEKRMRKVYLDNGSTSFPKAPGVGEAMSDFITEVGCNVGRGGYETAYDLGEKVYETRSQLEIHGKVQAISKKQRKKIGFNFKG